MLSEHDIERAATPLVTSLYEPAQHPVVTDTFRGRLREHQRSPPVPVENVRIGAEVDEQASASRQALCVPLAIHGGDEPVVPVAAQEEGRAADGAHRIRIGAGFKERARHLQAAIVGRLHERSQTFAAP
eukprot:scaffold211621_cov30-Tisochrysis_lutea.AAC.2